MAIARTFVKPGEQEGFWVEAVIELLAGCMMSMEENHPSYHIFKRFASSEYKTRNGIIDTLTAIFLEQGMHYKNTEFSK